MLICEVKEKKEIGDDVEKTVHYVLKFECHPHVKDLL